MNHGDAAPVVADGIVHVSFLSRGAHIKKNPSFLFVLVSAPFSVGFSFLSGSAPPPRSSSPSPPFSARAAPSSSGPGHHRPPPHRSLRPRFSGLLRHRSPPRVHDRRLPSRLLRPRCAHLRRLSSRRRAPASHHRPTERNLLSSVVSVAWLIVVYGRPQHAIPSASLHPLKGQGGRAHHPSSSVFCGLPRIPPLRFSRSRRFRDPAGSSGFPHYFSGSRPLSEFQGFPPILLWRPLSARSGCLPRSGCPPRSGCLPRSGFHPRSVRHPRSVCHPTSVCPSPDPKVCLSLDLGLSFTRLPAWTVSRMTRRSRRLRNMDPDDSLDAPALPPSIWAAGASSPAPLSAAGPSPSPVVLRVLPLRGSPAPIGYIYDASPHKMPKLIYNN